MKKIKHNRLHIYQKGYQDLRNRIADARRRIPANNTQVPYFSASPYKDFVTENME